MIARWRKTFADEEAKCPWPGPRPLSGQDRLIGRDDDIIECVRLVAENSMVVLNGDSGVGKSSLLNAGIVAALTTAGYTPLVRSNWEGVGECSDPETYIGDRLSAEGLLSPEVVAALEQGLPLVNALDFMLESAVLVLDQFEELIRYHPERFAQTMEWLLRANKSSRICIVLSLRSEYIHRLKYLNKNARPFSLAYFDVQPLTDPSEILQVIESGNRTGEEAIEETAVKELVRAWEQLPPSSPSRSLLYLQATLYALHWYAKKDGRRCVKTSDVLEMRKLSTATVLFSIGFDEAIALKLDRCAAACSSTAIDPVLIDGTREKVRECIAHLSSGGFKLEREEWDLAQLTLQRELKILCADTQPGEMPTRYDAEKLVRALSSLRSPPDVSDGADFLMLSRHDIADKAGLPWFLPGVVTEEDTVLAELGIKSAPWREDPNAVSAGVMMDMSPQAVLVEELRRFAFAMEWLITACMVRASTPGTQTMVSLIHDGFADALDSWAARAVADPSAPIAMLTAAIGEQFNWAGGSFRPAQQSDGESATPRYLVNLRWRFGVIRANFHNVVFVNCDFRGARFSECAFEGVTFINCLLDSASFEECRIIGQAEIDEAEVPAYMRDVLDSGKASLDDPLPEFVVPPTGRGLESPELTTLVGTLNHYRDTEASQNQLYSPTSGVAAVPWNGEVPAKVHWREQTGGVAMYGGRLSSLMIRNCSFEGGSMALCHIAGSSLDIVEQASGDFRLSYSTIRGLSVTRRVGESVQADDHLRVKVTDCMLADTWFGDELTGEVTIRKSRLWNLMNTSDSADLKVTIDDCSHRGLVNVANVKGGTHLTGYEIDRIVDRSDIVPAAGKMTYRSRPAEVELERRAGRRQARRSEADE